VRVSWTEVVERIWWGFEGRGPDAADAAAPFFVLFFFPRRGKSRRKMINM
jgi:hypothetical protein